MRKTRPLTVRRGAGPTSSGYSLRLSQSRPISRQLQGHSRCSPSLAGVSAHRGHHSVSVRRTEPLVTIWLRDPVDAARHSILSCWGILLREDGSGERYERPTRGFIQIPHELWTAGPSPQQRWYERLSLPALTFLLIALRNADRFGLRAERGPDYYGISADTLTRGARELRLAELLKIDKALITAPLAPSGVTAENRYTLRPPFGPQGTSSNAPSRSR